MTDINASDNCRLYLSPYKTLEYDLAFEGNNIKIMADILHQNWPTDGLILQKLKEYKEEEWGAKTDVEKAEAAYFI